MRLRKSGSMDSSRSINNSASLWLHHQQHQQIPLT